jgi:predicted phosphodiesterase
MTYGLISDIHGNLEALEAVLSQLEGAVEGFLCLGDIVGYGADPGACVDRVRALPDVICVAGNHDLAAIGRYDLEWFNPLAREAIQWTSEQLSPEQHSYLASLQLTVHVDRALLVHGSLPDEMAYITAPQEARVCFDAMPGDLTFVGHTHVAEYYRLRQSTRFPEVTPLWSGGRVSLESKLRYIVNPGAIGQPRDGNPAASFGVWDLEAGTVETRRLGYDIERAQGKMREAGLSEYLIERLSVGR